MDERWVNRSPEVMLETFHWFRGEGFARIVEDLLGMPREPRVIAEAFRLLPRLVRPLLAGPGGPRGPGGPGGAVWLIPAPGFRRAAFESRGSLGQIAGRTSNPERALRNLLERDGLFTERLHAEAVRLGLPVTDVDTPLSEGGLARTVATVLGL